MGWINPADSEEINEKPKNIESDIKSKIAQINNNSANSGKAKKFSFETKTTKGRNDKKSTFWCHYGFI